MSELFSKLRLRHVIDLAGTETVHGASPVSDEVISAVAEILPHRVEMAELQRAASEAISETSGAEAGCVTGCAAAGIAVSVAACMTGSDMARVEQLPDTTGMKNEVILQKGHDINFGASVAQMIRVSGAKVVEIGTATDCSLFQLQAAITPQTAAAVYVVSHHAVNSGLIGLEAFCVTCHGAGLPVIVDAAAEQDGRSFIASGADIVLFSAHKTIGAPTAGIIMGRKNLVNACMHQERGVGRTMKAGKEGVVGVIAALKRWESLDHEARQLDHTRLANLAVEKLSRIRGLRIDLEPDPTGMPFERVKINVEPSEAGLTAYQLNKALGAGDPKIAFRALHVDRGYIRGDFRQVDEPTLYYVCDRIAEIVGAASGRADDVPPPQRGDVAAEALRNWPPEPVSKKPSGSRGVGGKKAPKMR